MTIAPIVRSVHVKAAPARAFDLFTSHIEHWWPKGKTIGKAPHVALVLEPWAGGQWFSAMPTATKFTGAKYWLGSRLRAYCSAGRSTANGATTRTSSPRLR